MLDTLSIIKGEIVTLRLPLWIIDCIKSIRVFLRMRVVVYQMAQSAILTHAKKIRVWFPEDGDRSGGEWTATRW